MQHITHTWPDDKPVTAICVVEDISKKPDGFFAITKTYDHDSDADLWKGVPFFGTSRVSRYLCLSKTEGIGEYIVETIKVLDERETPPDGYSIIPRTIDTDAKAWKKRQICYSLRRRNLVSSAVSDIIFLSKRRKAPDGFKLAGNVNGMTVCYKVTLDVAVRSPAPALGYNLNPNGTPLPNLTSNKVINTPVNGFYPKVISPLPLGKQPTTPHDEYVNLIVPKRPAPPPPTSPQSNAVAISPTSKTPARPPPPLPRRPHQPTTPGNYATLAIHQGLEGVPFALHPSLELFLKPNGTRELPKYRFKKKEEIDKEFFYDFRLERQCT